MRSTAELNGEWIWHVDKKGPSEIVAEAADLIGRSIPARVPGAIHDDLLREGLIPDPLRDRNENAVEWVGRTDWRLSRSFGPVSAERVDLVFDGIDTVAAVEVNGTVVGGSRNMHRSRRYDVTGALAERNAIDIRFTSAYTEAEHWERELGARPSAYPQPFAFIRKMASSFGWDWGPTLVSCGLWRSVRLEAWSVARIASLRPLVEVDGATGILTAHVEIERAESGLGEALLVEVEVAGQRVIVEIADDESMATAVVTVPDVERWSPRGRGTQRRYDVAVTLSSHGERLDEERARVGFRTVALDRTPDADGTPFVVAVNGEPLFVRGVNWIPDRVLPGTEPAGSVRRRLEQAVEANVNLIRVWGGGVYESEEFYDACDELGLLVWQDFLFACAAYPEEEPIRSEVLAEARDNVTRLSAHPSLAIWNGTNENLWMRLDKEWASQPGGDLSWGERYYLEWLPEIVQELDPTRPYTGGSPWSGSWEHDPNDVDHETFHSWDVWNEDDFARYLESAPRFVSEFGWQGAPAWRTLRDAVSDPELRVDAPNVAHHQKAIDGHAKMARNLARHFPVATDFDRWHLQTQWLQVEAVRTGILHWRSHWPRTAGTILWQLNDLWAVTSWSAIDGDGRPKPLYFALREMYADRVLAIDPGAGGLELCAINDTANDWVGTVVIGRRSAATGAVLASQRLDFAAAPRSVARIAIPAALAAADDERDEVLVATLGAERAIHFFVRPKDAERVVPEVRMDIRLVDGGLDIVVEADGLVRDLLVQPDRIHPRATVDRGFTTLLPGERCVFRVRAPEPLSPSAAREAFAIASRQDAIDVGWGGRA